MHTGPVGANNCRCGAPGAGGAVVRVLRRGPPPLLERERVVCRVIFDDDRVQRGGQAAVVRLAAEIDASNADEIREQLLSVVNQGVSVMIADMSRTTFCDSAGVSALVRAFRRATENGTKFQLVATSPAVLRVLQITGVDRLIDIHSTVTEALGSPCAD